MQRTGRLMQNSPRKSKDKTVVRFLQVNKLHSLFLLYLRYNTTNTGNNVASLRYNNSNRTDRMLPTGCCDDAEARRKTQDTEIKPIKQATIQRYEFHFTSIQRTSSVTYFAVRKRTQHKWPQLKLGDNIYAIGPPVVGFE